jgi:membrane-bound lytic murein transglycosylase D
MEEPIPMKQACAPLAPADLRPARGLPARAGLVAISGLLIGLLAGCATPSSLVATAGRGMAEATLSDPTLSTSPGASADAKSEPATDPITDATAEAAAASGATAHAVRPASVDIDTRTASAGEGADAAAAPLLLDPPVQGDDSDLWLRLRAGYALPDLDNALVRKWETYYARRPDYMERMVERGGRYLFHILEEVDKRGMPADLALLPFIESAFNPQAVSHARASGMWQFMPATGRSFELQQNLFRDDRRDVLASTQAALDYLQMLHTQFGDWHLALAAYNWGQGNVQRAIRRNQAARKPTDYESLRMPAETRNYVPKLQAVKNLLLRPEDHGLRLPPLKNHPFFLSMPIVRDIDVALAARLAGIELETFQQLNPQLNKPVILAAGTPQVLLPYENAHHFAQALAQHRGPLASWTAWVAPRTLTPAAAAELVGLSEARLREINRIPPRMRVRAGSTLLVPRAAGSTQDVTEHVANTAMLALAPEGRGRRVVLRVGKQGDSVAAVARRHRLRAADVAAWNNVSTQARFRAGAQVIVYKAPVRQAATKRKAQQRAASTPRKASAKARAATKTEAKTSKPRGTARQATVGAPQAAAKLRVAQGEAPSAR